MTSETLDHYQKAFANLRIDRIPGRWGEETNKGAPHKAFLLLAIMDLIAQGKITTNFIKLDENLIDRFDLYWSKVMDLDKTGNIALPYYHMQSADFWHLIAIPDKEQSLKSPIRSVTRMRESVLGATFDDDLYTLLINPRTRDALRRVLIQEYFAPHIRPLLAKVGTITGQ